MLINTINPIHQQTIYTTGETFHGYQKDVVVGHTKFGTRRGYIQFELALRTELKTKAKFGPEELKKLQIDIHDLLKKYGLKI